MQRSGSRSLTFNFIFLIQGDFEVKVNLALDTIANLKIRLADESGIPAHVLQYK